MNGSSKEHLYPFEKFAICHSRDKSYFAPEDPKVLAIKKRTEQSEVLQAPNPYQTNLLSEAKSINFSRVPIELF